ncbi:hypothetical protein OS493_006629 [Desmophyllum pertusum]|uniref:TOCA HR1 domain-containing protein n=1 Tax=Desmophyllum pertusum TaxID=174260 RepID=A0A9W9ZRK5_9CNID|nr:hypothetical protein OS493_006629 [Desmophyllum pertusum]
MLKLDQASGKGSENIKGCTWGPGRGLKDLLAGASGRGPEGSLQGPGRSLNTLKSSWENTIFEMESEADIHRTLGNQLHDEVSKQAKRGAYTKTREAEVMFEQIEEARAGRGSKVLSEKEISKTEEQVTISSSPKLIGLRYWERNGWCTISRSRDKEYRDLYEKTEKLRLEWEAAMLKFCQTCEKLEEERITHLREMCSLYSNMLAAVIPQLQQNYDNVSSEVWKINSSEDVITAANTRGEPRGPAQQILYDCYEEDLEIPMNFDRRRVGLETKIQLLSESLEKQKKTKDGITSLFEAYSATPDYCNEEGQQDVATQLTHANAIINSLTASVSKVQAALAELNGNNKPDIWLMTYISTSKDRQGMLQSYLKIPLDQVVESGMQDERDNKSDDEFDDFPESPGE